MEKVRVEDAVGMVLAHDLTKIVPGTFKGAAFKKGYIIREADIEELKNMGKNHILVVPLTEDQVHENEAAERIAIAASSSGLAVSGPSEGKANIKAAVNGLFKVNCTALNELNQIGNIALVTLHNNSIIKENQTVAAAKIIPLTIDREDVAKAERICRLSAPVIDIKPQFPLKTGIIVTGTEVYHGRIQDRFGETLKNKITGYGGDFLDLQYAPDEPNFIFDQIMELIQKGAEIVLISGGMAVDADDVTPLAIRKAATEVISYGVPVLPGSMCMIAYHKQIPVFGIPACVMFSKTTIFDLVFPRMLAKERLRRDDLIALAHGGMCLQCVECRYPACSFGR